MSTTQDGQGNTQEPEEPADRVRVCRKCSTQSTGSSPFCPQCGTRFDRRRLSKRGKLIAVAVGMLLLGGGATAGLLVKHHNDTVARQHRLAAVRAANARAAAHEAARQAEAAKREKARAAHRLEVLLRKALVKDLQRSITKDAIKNVNDGLLEGPILHSECTPVAGGNIDDTAQHTGNFSCLAVSTINGDGTMSGYRFSATVNYEDNSYTWHLGG